MPRVEVGCWQGTKKLLVVRSVNQITIKFIPFGNGHGGKFVADVHHVHILMNKDDSISKRVLQKIAEATKIWLLFDLTEGVPT